MRRSLNPFFRLHSSLLPSPPAQSFMMQSCRKACKVCSVHPATASSATTITSDAATDAHTALSTSIKKHAAAADHIDAAAVRENGEGEGEGKAQALAAGGSVGSGTRAARGLGAEAKGAGDDELEGVGGRRGTEGEDQQVGTGLSGGIRSFSVSFYFG